MTLIREMNIVSDVHTHTHTHIYIYIYPISIWDCEFQWPCYRWVLLIVSDTYLRCTWYIGNDCIVTIYRQISNVRRTSVAKKIIDLSDVVGASPTGTAPTTSERSTYHLGAVSIRKTVLPGMAIPMLKIRRPNGRLIFNMEIAIRR